MISNGIILISLAFNINHMTQITKMDAHMYQKKITMIQSINLKMQHMTHLIIHEYSNCHLFYVKIHQFSCLLEFFSLFIWIFRMLMCQNLIEYMHSLNFLSFFFVEVMLFSRNEMICEMQFLWWIFFFFLGWRNVTIYPLFLRGVPFLSFFFWILQKLMKWK